MNHLLILGVAVLGVLVTQAARAAEAETSKDEPPTSKVQRPTPNEKSGDGWTTAKSPLVTRWAKDVRPEKVLPEYPRPQMVRKDFLNLNGLWEFSPADDLKAPPTGKTLDQNILVPFCMESALSGVGKHSDHAWYRRTVEVPGAWRENGQRVLLHFGAVDYESVVLVNGKEVGRHVGGYDAFTFDVTDALNREGPQQIVVGVTDVTAETQARGKQTTEPRGIWYTPCSGIWQTVWMEPVPKTYIRGIKIRPDVDGGAVFVSVDVAGETKDVIVHAVVPGVDGKEDEKSGTHGPVGTEIKIAIADARLWSPESPHLYDLKVHLHTSESGEPRAELIDEVASYFGMRKIDVAPDEKGVPRIRLNNKPYMQVGPLDQGFWPDGIYTAPTDEALKYDLEMEKKLGFNMLRKHVKIEPQRFYYWCDKLGLLVWQDMPSPLAKSAGEWQKQFEVEMKAMVEQHINSPSIVTWVPFNEGWGQTDPYGKEGTTRIANWIKQLDPTRLVNNASGWTDAGAGDVHDIHNYPGPAAPPVEKQRAIVLGEFGGLGLPVEGHMWEQRAWGYQNMPTHEELTEKYVRLLGRLWELNESAGLCAGVYTQTTDVESEANGLMTYDREVLKVDQSKVREANLGHGPRYTVSSILKAAKEGPSEWKYTFDKPANGWEKPAFDDSSWKTGPSGFGTDGTPAGAPVRTKWDTSDIYLRREVVIPADAVQDAVLTICHDEAAEVYVNGVLAAKVRDHTPDYIERRINEPARQAIVPGGKNVIAVHCNQTTGGQFIDVGIVRLVEKK